jgi:O-acetyl-ADP-ribose deacetylase (regulator of RNase III)
MEIVGKERARRRKMATATPITSKNYEKSHQEAQERFEKIEKQHEEPSLLAVRDFNGKRLVLKKGDITQSKAEILVSSDDNYLQASGGVSAKIVKLAGDAVRTELNRYARSKLRYGAVVTTTGGDSAWRAIIHPAVFDLDQSRFPCAEVVSKVVERAFVIAEAMGSKTIAFPAIGSGTGKSWFSVEESADTIVKEINNHLSSQATCHGLECVELYLYEYDPSKIDDKWIEERSLQKPKAS